MLPVSNITFCKNRKKSEFHQNQNIYQPYQKYYEKKCDWTFRAKIKVIKSTL